MARRRKLKMKQTRTWRKCRECVNRTARRNACWYGFGYLPWEDRWNGHFFFTRQGKRLATPLINFAKLVEIVDWRTRKVKVDKKREICKQSRLPLRTTAYTRMLRVPRYIYNYLKERLTSVHLKEEVVKRLNTFKCFYICGRCNFHYALAITLKIMQNERQPVWLQEVVKWLILIIYADVNRLPLTHLLDPLAWTAEEPFEKEERAPARLKEEQKVVVERESPFKKLEKLQQQQKPLQRLQPRLSRLRVKYKPLAKITPEEV